MNPQQFALDTLVELQDQYSKVYPSSPTGARGWVRARRELPKMDAEVFIEWDKNHWRYHGERDGWTYEHHFRAVDEPLVDGVMQAPSMHQILEEAHRKIDAERCEHCGDLHDDEQQQFIDTLMEAQESALGSSAYFIMTLAPRQEGELVIYEPQVFTDALDPAARAMVETQLAYIAAQLFESYMLGRVKDIEGRPDDP